MKTIVGTGALLSGNLPLATYIYASEVNDVINGGIALVSAFVSPVTAPLSLTALLWSGSVAAQEILVEDEFVNNNPISTLELVHHDYGLTIDVDFA